MKEIQLNEQEAEALLKFIDTALKVQGLQAANDALHLSNKIVNAFKDESEN